MLKKTIRHWTIFLLTISLLLLGQIGYGQIDTLSQRGKINDGLLRTPRPDSVAKKDSSKYFTKYPEYYNAKLYNSKRQIVKDGVFKKDSLITGKEYVYDKNGLLIEIKIFKDCKYDGDDPIEEKKE